MAFAETSFAGETNQEIEMNETTSNEQIQRHESNQSMELEEPKQSTCNRGLYIYIYIYCLYY